MLDSSIFDQYLEAISSAPACYVGFSGGLDSTVLLHLAAAWHAGRPDLPPLKAIHINHQLQAGSDGWQAHCQSVCDELGIPLTACSVDVAAAGGGETGARKARYEVFGCCLNEGADRGAALLLAHHKDDQVETFFLRLMRGSGLEGLSAIPGQRSLGEGLLLRPLLDVSRGELEEFARERGLTHVEDPSNADTGMDRNFLRNEVLALLETRWPAYRDTVARASAHIAEAASALAAGLGELDERRSVMGDPGLALAEILSRPPEEARRVLRSWLRGKGLHAPDESLLGEFLRQLENAAEDSNPRLATGSYIVSRFGDAVYLHPPVRDVAGVAEATLNPGESCVIAGVGNLGLYATEGPGMILSTDEAVQIRLRSGGERCKIAGRKHSTSLKNLFQELSVPPWWRERIPLVYGGDELLAIGDLKLCEPARPEEGRNGRWSLIWQRESPPFD
jgi:tRNA(Ile)-lysidine synthase